MIQKVLESQIARYILMGGAAFAIELTALLTLSSLGVHRGIAVAISFWVGFIAALILQKFFAFKDTRKQPSVIVRQTVLFGLLVAFNYVFTIAVVSLFPEKYLVISRTLAIIAVTFWNYFLYKNVIFKKTKKPSKTFPQLLDQLKNYIVGNKLTLLFYAGCSLLVVLFFAQYFATGEKTLMDDFDYYSQLYEAFRINVIEFGQFPAYNPWLSGGVPLWQNPQFGLVSLQSLLVLPFGSIMGMKIAYIIYALIGFWGMYILARLSFKATKMRAALVAFIWVFSGFFAGHGISHFTFTSFFFIPLIVFFLIERDRLRYAWLGLGIIMAVITLSSVHYATLFSPVIIALFIFFSLFRINKDKKDSLLVGISLKLKDLYFILKSVGVFIVLAGWQFIATYSFVSNNERLIDNGWEEYLKPTGIIKALFMPVDASIVPMPSVTWGWGEYSMYMGFAMLVIVGIIGFVIIKRLIQKKAIPLTKASWVIVAAAVGVLGMILALGDFGPFSPFHLLHELPGFTQTRVPSRWMIYTVLAILILVASWKAQPKVINSLLVLCVIELFITFGPVYIYTKNWTSLPQTTFSSQFTNYDNNLEHTQHPDKPMHYYWYTTRLNTGQVYADDSIINTLSFSPPLESSRCAQNTDPDCRFIRTDNADLVSWSPNKIVVKRTGPGNISLNINVDASWRINGEYLYAQNKKVEPIHDFILPGNEDTYTLEYAPKFSPSWITWRIDRLF